MARTNAALTGAYPAQKAFGAGGQHRCMRSVAGAGFGGSMIADPMAGTSRAHGRALRLLLTRGTSRS